MKRRLFTGLMLIGMAVILALPAAAQEATPDDIALGRIQEAAATGATELDLSGLGLTALPAELWQLTALERLDLSENQLTTLPPEIGRLTALMQLYLGDNLLR